MADVIPWNVFRRKLLIASRILAGFLILSIFLFSYIEFYKWRDFNSARLKYGDDAYCYMCGLEAGRSCGCVYLPDLANDVDSVEAVKVNLAIFNVQPCENRNLFKRDINITEQDLYNVTVL